jgi:VIT1/CCC1 family predicted Fe2+/Mn2+ transporter
MDPRRAAPRSERRWHAFARPDKRDLVYSAHDGRNTPSSVVAGVRGADLSPLVVLALGFANLAADGLAMGVGNYLGIKSERAAELGEAYDEQRESREAARHGSVTWVSFVSAGLVPLLPFLAGLRSSPAFVLSLALTCSALFTVGALRTQVTGRHWLRSGLEMLFIGAIAGGAAFLAGDLVARLASGGPPASG